MEKSIVSRRREYEEKLERVCTCGWPLRLNGREKVNQLVLPCALRGATLSECVYCEICIALFLRIVRIYRLWRMLCLKAMPWVRIWCVLSNCIILFCCFLVVRLNNFFLKIELNIDDTSRFRLASKGKELFSTSLLIYSLCWGWLSELRQNRCVFLKTNKGRLTCRWWQHK